MDGDNKVYEEKAHDQASNDDKGTASVIQRLGATTSLFEQTTVLGNADRAEVDFKSQVHKRIS